MARVGHLKTGTRLTCWLPIRHALGGKQFARRGSGGLWLPETEPSPLRSERDGPARLGLS